MIYSFSQPTFFTVQGSKHTRIIKKMYEEGKWGRDTLYTDTQSSSFQFVMCWRTQAPQSDSFPYSEHVLKSRQGAQCLFLNGLYFSKPDYRCEQAVRENCSFIIFFSHHQMQILFPLFGGMYCFSVCLIWRRASVLLHISCTEWWDWHLSLLSAECGHICVGTSLHPIFSLVFCNWILTGCK